VSHSIVEGGWPGEGEGNLDVDPRFVDHGSGDLHLLLDCPAVDAGVPLEGVPDLDVEGDPRTVDGDGDGVAIVDIGADEMVPEVAVRFGTTAGLDGWRSDPLRVNGQTGDRRRVVRVGRFEPLWIEMAAPPHGPSPARFACYAWLDEPDRITLTVQPFGLGTTGFPTFLAGGPGNLPLRTWNNLGHRRRLGEPDLPSTPAPSVLLDRVQSVSLPSKVTLQGFIEDLGSEAQGPVSITNAVVLEALDE